MATEYAIPQIKPQWLNRREEKDPNPNKEPMKTQTIAIPQLYEDVLQEMVDRGFMPSRSEAIRVAISLVLERELKVLEILSDISMQRQINQIKNIEESESSKVLKGLARGIREIEHKKIVDIKRCTQCSKRIHGKGFEFFNHKNRRKYFFCTKQCKRKYLSGLPGKKCVCGAPLGRKEVTFVNIATNQRVDFCSNKCKQDYIEVKRRDAKS